jgi:hypothetical protein
MIKKITEVKSGDPITARSYNSLARAINTLAQNSGFNKLGTKKRSRLSPFSVSLFTEVPSDPEAPEYYVIVSDGRVIEISADQEVILHEATNRLDEEDQFAKFTIVADEAVYLSFLAPDGVIDPESVEIKIDESSATPEEGEYLYKLAEIKMVNDSLNVVPFCAGSHIFFGSGGSGETIRHPWKVVADGLGEPPEEGVPLRRWAYTGGVIHTNQGDWVTIPDGTVEGNDGGIYIEIMRDADSREITSAVVSFIETEPISDNVTQYRAIAQIIGEPPPDPLPDPPPTTPPNATILQLQFEEIRLREELVIDSGEFALDVFELSHRNSYALPS